MRKLIISSVNFGICLLIFFSACAKSRVIRNAGYDPNELERGVTSPNAVDSFGLVPPSTPPLCEPLGTLEDPDIDEPPQLSRGQLVAIQPGYLFDSEVAGNKLKYWKYQKKNLSFGRAQSLDFGKLEPRERDLFTSDEARFAMLPMSNDQNVFAVVDDLANSRIRLFSFPMAVQNDSSVLKPKQLREWVVSGSRVLHFFQKSPNEVLVALRAASDGSSSEPSSETEVRVTKLKWGPEAAESQEIEELGSFQAARNIELKGEVPEGVLYTEGNLFSGIKLFLLRRDLAFPTLLFSGPLLESFASEDAIYAHVLKTPSFALDPIYGYTAVGGLWKIKVRKSDENGLSSFTDLIWQRLSRINYEKIMWLRSQIDAPASKFSGPIGVYQQQPDEEDEAQDINRVVQRLIGIISEEDGNENSKGKDLELGTPCASSLLNPIFYLQEVGVFGISGTQEILRIAPDTFRNTQ